MEIADLIAGMATKDMQGKGTWLALGFVGLVKMKGLKANPKGHKGKSAIFEFEVLETNQPEKDPVGSTRNQVIKLEGAYAAKDVKEIMFSITGTDPASVPVYERAPDAHNEIMATFKEAWDDGSAIAGLIARVEATPHKTKGDEYRPSTVITINKWSPATPEQCAKYAPDLYGDAA